MELKSVDLDKMFWENNPRLMGLARSRNGIPGALKEIAAEIDADNRPGYRIKTVMHSGKEESFVLKADGSLAAGVTPEMIRKWDEAAMLKGLEKRNIDPKDVDKLLP